MTLPAELQPPPDLTRRWREEGWWTDDTVADQLHRAAASWPDRELVVASATRPATIRLAELHRRALAVAAGMRRLGVRPGDVVAVQTPAWLETWLAYSGAFLAGAVILPVVPIYGAAELGFILGEARPRLILTPSVWKGIDYEARIAELGLDARHVVIGEETPRTGLPWSELEAGGQDGELPRRRADDVAVLIYTSGTTSAPKGAQHSHRTLLAEIAVSGEGRKGGERRMLIAWPPGHVAGLLTYLRFTVEGISSVLMDGWNAEQAARLIEEHRITSSAGTTFHLTSLLDAADAAGLSLQSMVDYRAGGVTVPAELVTRCDRRGFATFRSYGLTEHPTVAYGHPEYPAHVRATTDGRASPGTEIRIVDDDGVEVAAGQPGEVVCRGPETFIGYRRPELNDTVFMPGGWLKTGDIGVLSAEGYLTITDRKKDIIIRGGENISSREVEEYALRDPNIVEAAAVGVPDPRLGERVGLFVITRDGGPATVERMSALFSRLGVTRQKTPEFVFCVEDLPRNAAGKVMKHVLRRQIPPA
jgi:acyl-CoA synthetase (AMP-forming)/AMP-acid ligase II